MNHRIGGKWYEPSSFQVYILGVLQLVILGDFSVMFDLLSNVWWFNFGNKSLNDN